MRLLVLCEVLGPDGGMERYLETVLPVLADRCSALRVLSRRITGDHAPLDVREVAWSEEHEPPNVAAADAIRSQIADFRPDLVIAHNVMDAGVMAAARDASRLVAHLHDHRVFCPNGDRLFPRSRTICTATMGIACSVNTVLQGCMAGPRPPSFALLQRRKALRDTYRAADAFVTASAYMTHEAINNGIERTRIHTLPLPLPDTAFASAIAPQPDPEAIVLFSARIAPQKGLQSLVDAIARIAKKRRPILRIAGVGPDLEPSIAHARSRGVLTEELGRLDREAMQAAIDAASVIAVPSLWAEPFGYVGIEALARGKPVAAYDVGGIRTWLDDGRNGYLAPVGDTSELAQAIIALLDPILHTDFSFSALASAERFRLAPHVKRLEEVYAAR